MPKDKCETHVGTTFRGVCVTCLLNENKRLQEEPDLSLVSTEDMMEEIIKRNEASLLMTYRMGTKPGENEVLWRYSGGAIPCLGLAYSMINRLNMEQMALPQTSEDPPEDDS